MFFFILLSNLLGVFSTPLPLRSKCGVGEWRGGWKGGGRGFDGEESRLLTWHGVNLLRGRNSIRLRPN